MRPDPIDYEAFCVWLSDELAWRRVHGDGMTLRDLAKCAHLSAGYLSNLVNGKRPMSRAMAERLLACLDIDPEAAAYLLALVDHANADTPDARAAARLVLEGAREVANARGLTAHHEPYMEQWFTVIIREMMTLPDFQHDPAWIAARVVPPITEAEATEALAVLASRKIEGGGALSTGHHPQREIGVAWRRQMIEHATHLFERFPREERFATAIIAALPESQLVRIREEIKQFAARIVALCEAAPQPHERVHVVQVQLFPATTPPTDEPVARADGP